VNEVERMLVERLKMKMEHVGSFEHKIVMVEKYKIVMVEKYIMRLTMESYLKITQNFDDD